MISFLESTVLAAVPPGNTVTAQELGLATGRGLGLWTSDGIGTVWPQGLTCDCTMRFSMNMVRNHACNPSTRKTRQAPLFGGVLALQSAEDWSRNLRNYVFRAGQSGRVCQFFVKLRPNFWIFWREFEQSLSPGCRSLGRAAFDALDTCEVGNPLCRCRFCSMGTDTYTDVDFPYGFPGIPSIQPPRRLHSWTPILERQRRAIAVQWVCTSGCALVVEDLRRLTGFPRLFIWGKNWKSGDEKRF